MADHAVALVLTFAEAAALFEAAKLGLHKRAELGMSTSEKAVEAMKKIAHGMGFETTMDGAIVLLLPPPEED
jgi:hypothetical protein